ncbi:flagellar hook-length control protein FliK [Pseudobacteriovorax antillogorgiicola]|uniref:Hook-length control protein FliK n=1 Tax=Pseudobacteriovorax antillogorgiicola TaxID=1513793 RepID=A0A1Y6CR30_9BACT|nr:flagellar hook-length control protein FliK [Pseudobacteriovorax antillogorgiicola]TCS46711.1 flagellar hook-length control protein FliK [Pseudobacteriovorax antillogorgiicola]SMF66984.1 hook-length control protein FliK [Pseudobacteriovorax antillogorgiicola]
MNLEFNTQQNRSFSLAPQPKLRMDHTPDLRGTPPLFERTLRSESPAPERLRNPSRETSDRLSERHRHNSSNETQNEPGDSKLSDDREELRERKEHKPSDITFMVPVPLAGLVPPQAMMPDQAIATEGQDVMQTLGTLYSNQDQLRRDAPILSLLTGKLEQLNPQVIPGLVTENNFIQNAMSAEDIYQFLSTPQDLPQMIDDLGLSKIAEAMQGMEITDSFRTPAQVLDTLGLDSQLIQSELSVLKGYLDTDGLNPYMVRAAALAGQSKTMDSIPSPAAGPWEQIPMNADPSQQTKGSALSRAFNQIQSEPNAPPRPETLGATHTTIQTLPNVVTIPQTPDDFISLGEQDPFKQMEGSWQNVESFANQKPTVPIAPTEEIQRMAVLKDISYSTLQRNAAIAEQVEADNLDQIDIPIQDLGDGIAGAEEGIMPSSTLSSDDGERNHQDSHGERGRQEEPGLGPIRNAVSDTSTPTNFTVDEAAPQDSVDQVKQVRKLILDKAQMMLKEGGGSIKVDLGTPSLGQLDLAIDVSNDAIKLRITAESDRAREMIAQELPALRQALLDQSLDLKTVEIGLRYEEQWNQGHPEQRQEQQHDRGHERDETIVWNRESDDQKSWQNGIQRQLHRQSITRAQPHSGNIQIRV